MIDLQASFPILSSPLGMAMITQVFLSLLSNSPELLIGHEIQQSETRDLQHFFILSQFKLPTASSLGIVSIVGLTTLIRIIRVFIFKNQSEWIEVFLHIMLPLQIFLCLRSIIEQGLNETVSIFYEISYGITLLNYGINILVHLKLDNEILKIQYCLNRDFILFRGVYQIGIFVLPFLIFDQGLMTVALLVIALFGVIRSVKFFRQVQYETPAGEWIGCLHEMICWFSFSQMALRLVFGVDTSIMSWLLLATLMALVAYPQNYSTASSWFIQKKYEGYFEIDQCNYDISGKSQERISNSQTIKLSLLIFMARQSSQHTQWSFRPFSPLLSGKVDRYLRSCQSFQYEGQFSPSNKKNNSKQDRQSNQVDLLWKLSMQVHKYRTETKEFVFDYAFRYLPRLSTISYVRMAYLFYQKQQTQIQSLETKLERQYKFRAILNHFAPLTFKQDMIKRYQQNGNKSAKCLGIEMLTETSTYSLYYNKIVFQKQLILKMKQFAQIERSIILLLEGNSKLPKKQIFNFLKKKFDCKKEIQAIQKQFLKIPGTNNAKYLYLIQNYILKAPFLAQTSLKGQIKEQINERRYHKSQNLWNSKETQTNILAIVSGISDKGRIFNENSQFIKMFESRSKQSSMRKPHISDFILQCWRQDHCKAINSTYDSEHLTRHVGKQFHMVSLKSQKLYQISYEPSYLFSIQNDLLMVLDISARRLKSLTIFHEEKELYNSKHLYSQYPLSESRVVSMKSSGKKRTLRHEVEIFGKLCLLEYEFQLSHELQKGFRKQSIAHFKAKNQTQNRLQIDNNSLDSLLIDEQLGNLKTLTTKKQIISVKNKVQCTADQLKSQAKMQQYKQSLFIAKSHYLIYTVVPFIVVAGAVGASYLIFGFISTENQKVVNIYTTKNNLLSSFFLTDMKVYIEIYVLSFFVTGFIDFTTPSQPDAILSAWRQNLLMESGHLNERVLQITQSLQMQNDISPLMFERSNSRASFLLRQIEYDIDFYDWVRVLGYEDIVSDSPSSRDQPFLNWVEILLIRRFYNYHVDELLKYYNTQKSGMLDRIAKVEEQAAGTIVEMYSLIAAGVAILTLSGVVLFVYNYLSFNGKLTSHVEKIFTFSKSVNRELSQAVSELDDYLEEIQTVDASCLQQSHKSLKQSKREEFQLNNHEVQKEWLQQKSEPMSTLKLSWIELFVFFWIALIGISLPLFTITTVSHQQSRHLEFLKANEQLTKVSGLSLDLMQQFLLSVRNGNPLDSSFQSYIHEMDSFDKSAIVRVLEPYSFQNQQKILYSPICADRFENISCSNYSDNFLSYSETYSSSLLRFRRAWGQFNANNSNRPRQIAGDEFQKLYQEVTRLLTMTRKIQEIGKQNYDSGRVDLMDSFKLLVAVFVGLGSLVQLFNPFYVYPRVKKASTEVLSMARLEAMDSNPQFSFHVNQSRQQIIQRYFDD